MAPEKFGFLKSVGPGLVVAAAGIGAGDVITSTVVGARFGTTLLWAIALAALLKLFINENIARWQLATGTTLVQGWMQRLPKIIPAVFGAYLFLWTFLVGGSLSNACAIAGHTLFPAISVPAWGILHSLVALLLVWWGRFEYFQRLMKALVGVMAITVVACAVWLSPDIGEVARGLLVPSLPEGSGRSVLAVFGGIGGSVTMMCYGYWIRENHWGNLSHLRKTWMDLGLAYGLTAIFGICLSIIAAGCNPNVASGSGVALEVAARLEAVLGSPGRWAFLIGFWCAVFTAMLGVWQGVPYIFEDFVSAWSRPGVAATPRATSAARLSPVYRGALLYLAIPPLSLLYFKSPVQIVVTFTIAGAFIMPFLAGTLLYMNNRREWVGSGRNPAWLNAGLFIALAVFTYVCYTEVAGYLN